MDIIFGDSCGGVSTACDYKLPHHGAYTYHGDVYYLGVQDDAGYSKVMSYWDWGTQSAQSGVAPTTYLTATGEPSVDLFYQLYASTAVPVSVLRSGGVAGYPRFNAFYSGTYFDAVIERISGEYFSYFNHYEFIHSQRSSAGQIVSLGVKERKTTFLVNLDISVAYFSNIFYQSEPLRIESDLQTAVGTGTDTCIALHADTGLAGVLVAYPGKLAWVSVNGTTTPTVHRTIDTGVGQDLTKFHMIAGDGTVLLYNTTDMFTCNFTATTFTETLETDITDAEYDWLRNSTFHKYNVGHAVFLGTTTEAPIGTIFMNISPSGIPYYGLPSTYAQDYNVVDFLEDLTGYTSTTQKNVCLKATTSSSNPAQGAYFTITGTLDAPVGHIYGIGTVEMPTRTIEGVGDYYGVIGRGAVDQPNRTVSATGTVPIVGVGTVRQPKRTIVGYGDGKGLVSMPRRTISGYGIVPISGVGTVARPKYKVTGVGTLSTMGVGTVRVPVRTVFGTGTKWFEGIGQCIRPALSILGIGENDATNIGSVDRPMYLVQAVGYTNTTEDDISFRRDTINGIVTIASAEVEDSIEFRR